MPCSYIGGNVPKLIVQDIFWNIPRKKNITVEEFLSHVFPIKWRAPCPVDYTHICIIDKMGKNLSADYLPDKSRNLSLCICHWILEREKIRNTSGKVSINRAENIFPKYFFVLSSWNSSEVSEGEEIYVQLLRQCTSVQGSCRLPKKQHKRQGDKQTYGQHFIWGQYTTVQMRVIYKILEQINPKPGGYINWCWTVARGHVTPWWPIGQREDSCYAAAVVVGSDLLLRKN